MAIDDATVAPDAGMENVWVEKDGTVDFYNDTLTKNGRAVIQISRVANTDGDIDMPVTNMIFFITRNRLMPPVVRLNMYQAACAFMLGESIKTSAADPLAKGEAVREVGTNPFVGPKGEEGNRLLELLQHNPDIQSYILNTGSVGEGDQRHNVKLPISVAILRAIVRDDVEWEMDADLKLEVPSRVGGFDLDPYRLQNRYEPAELKRRLEETRKERRAWLANFPTANREVVEAVY
jgi:phosphoenolpyruvate carboxykinase (ATP)